MAADMWMVVAIIQGFRLDAVTRALEQLPGFGGMTVSDCRGFGHEKVGVEEEDRGLLATHTQEADLSDFKPKVRLDIAVVGRDQADAVAYVIARKAHTGRGGDGKIFLWPITQAIRVRNFGLDQQAL